MAPGIHPSNRGGQGTWFLAVVAVLGSAVPVYAHRVEKHFAVSSRPCVMVRNSSGTVTVHTWQKPEVQVIGDHLSNKVEVDAVEMGNRVEVETHQLSENVSLQDLTATYEIMVPQETTLQIHNDSGMVLVVQVIGDITLEAVAATVNLERVAGYVRVKTVGGSFTCKECSGRIEANSISGNLNLVRGQSGYIQAQTSSGNILLDSELLPNGYYHLKNVSGQIEMRFSPADSFDLTAISYKGAVQNEATLKPRHNPRHMPSDPRVSSMFGTYNEGKAHVELTSFSGKIQILKRP